MKFTVIIIAAALIAVGGNVLKAQPVETELGDWSTQALATNALGWAHVEMHGRDAYVYGEAPDLTARQQTIALIDDVWGVRTAHDRMTLAQDDSVSADTLGPDPEGRVEMSAADMQPFDVGADDNRPEPIEDVEPEVVNNPTGGGLPSDDREPAGVQERGTAGEIENTQDITHAAPSSAISEPGPSSTADCQSAFDAVISEENIRFAFNSTEIDPASHPLLDRIADIARGCPAGVLEVGGHTDNIGTAEANRYVSGQRAQSVADYLIVSGISETRVTAIGYGLDNPVASNDNAAGRARNRRVAFTLLDSEE